MSAIRYLLFAGLSVSAIATAAPLDSDGTPSVTFIRSFDGSDLSDFQSEILQQIAVANADRIQQMIDESALAQKVDEQIFKKASTDFEGMGLLYETHQNLDRRRSAHMKALANDLQAQATKLFGERLSPVSQLNVECSTYYRNVTYHAQVNLRTWRVQQKYFLYVIPQSDSVDIMETTIVANNHTLHICSKSAIGSPVCKQLVLAEGRII